MVRKKLHFLFTSHFNIITDPFLLEFGGENTNFMANRVLSNLGRTPYQEEKNPWMI